MSEQTKMGRPMVGVGIFVEREGLILMGKRKGSHGAGEWSLPGGHMEAGESFMECCTRELREETGLVLLSQVELGFTNNIFPDHSKHYVTLFFLADAHGMPENLEPDRCEEWCWFPLDELPEPMFGGIRDMLPTLRKALSVWGLAR